MIDVKVTSDLHRNRQPGGFLSPKERAGCQKWRRTKSIMKSKLLAACLPAFLVAASVTTASALEIQAESIRSEDGSRFQYSDNVEIRFAPDEAFEIAADEIAEQDGIAHYSGHARITFAAMRLEADTASLRADADGSHLIKSENADMIIGKP